MATKRIQTFVKNKVNTHSNKILHFSKQKPKIDHHEEVLKFDYFDSDKDDFNNDLAGNITRTGNDKYKSEVNRASVCNNQDKVERKSDEMYLSIMAHLTVKGNISTIDDEHTTPPLNKRIVRKPSEVTREKRVGGFGKKIISEKAIYREDDNHMKDITLSSEFLNIDNKSSDNNVSIDASQSSNIPKLTTVQLNEDIDNLIVNNTSYTEPENNINRLEIIQSLSFVELKVFIAVGALLLLFVLFSVSSFILGWLCGILISFGVLKLYNSVLWSMNDIPISNNNYPKLRDLSSPVIPRVKEFSLVDEYASTKSSFSVWVNAINSYNPSRNMMATSYSLHMSLQGTTLRMRQPKTKVSSRAMWNDKKITGVTMVSDREVDLLNAKIHILPADLVHRRLWSKKYPIGITIRKTKHERDKKTVVSHSNISDPNSFETSSDEENIFFFTRTGREKEEIFRRLVAASKGVPIKLNISSAVNEYLSKEVPSKISYAFVYSGDNNDDKNTDASKEDGLIDTNRDTTRSIKEPQMVTFARYMAKFMPSDMLLFEAKTHKIDLNYISCQPELQWLNGLIGRVAWDVFLGDHWIRVISRKICTKLKKLHLPYFIDPIEIVDIDLGNEIPVIRTVSTPYMDYRGLWVTFEVMYAGGFSMALDSKINLMKLRNRAKYGRCARKKGHKSKVAINKLHDNEINSDSGSDNVTVEVGMHMTTDGGAATSNEDEENDYPDLSSDENTAIVSDSDLTAEKDGNPLQSPSNNRFLKLIDELVISPYFQKALEYKYVLQAMKYVSNTSLQLQVDTKFLSGILVLNIPPPPSDRLWWGFKESPQLNVKVQPKIGNFAIQMKKLEEFIEKKLIQEFHRTLVLPNMDDLVIPLLCNGNPEQYSQTLF